jgi:hypothetical protein
VESDDPIRIGADRRYNLSGRSPRIIIFMITLIPILCLALSSSRLDVPWTAGRLISSLPRLHFGMPKAFQHPFQPAKMESLLVLVIFTVNRKFAIRIDGWDIHKEALPRQLQSANQPSRR